MTKKQLTIEDVMENESLGIYTDNASDFAKDLKEAIAYQLGFNYSQADIIYCQAWYDGQSGGYTEVIYKAINIVTLFEAVNDAKWR